MQFRVATWNVNHRNFRPTHAQLLEQQHPHLLALQEVSFDFFNALEQTRLFSWSTFSLSLRPPRDHEGRSRRLGCAVFGRAPFQFVSAELLKKLAFPERALVVSAKMRSANLTMCSFHTPPGASWGEVKPKTLEAIAKWLATQPGHTIFGIDANAPKTDHPVFEQNEWWWDAEPTLLGHAPLHDLSDCLRLHLKSKPQQLEDILRKRPTGPLAVSHIRGNRRKMTKCRYDFIYVSPGFDVIDVTYLYEESITAGSDHAMVTALLNVTT